MSNAEVEIGENKLDSGKEESCEWNIEDCWVGRFCFGVPAKSIVPGNFDFVDLYATRLGETETDVVLVMLERSISNAQRAWRNTYSKLHSGLCGGYDSEDVMLCSGVYTFEDRQVRDDTAGVEVFESIEDQMVSVVFWG